MTPLSMRFLSQTTRSSPLRRSIDATLKNSHSRSFIARINVSPGLMSASMGCGGNVKTAASHFSSLPVLAWCCGLRPTYFSRAIASIDSICSVSGAVERSSAFIATALFSRRQ